MQTIFQRCRFLFYLFALAIIIEGIPLTIVQAEEKVEVRNVRFEVSGKVIVLNYDLQGPANRDYKVSLTLKRKMDITFQYKPIVLKGSVGEDCQIGDNKQITWDILKEMPQGLEGDDFYFIIQAELIPASSYTWWYIAGGAAVVGGAVAYIVLSKGGGETTLVAQGFPKPVGRPVGN
ncbi:MAG: hypothetical protein ABSB78_02835 [Bacteroidota bacterium]